MAPQKTKSGRPTATGTLKVPGSNLGRGGSILLFIFDLSTLFSYVYNCIALTSILPVRKRLSFTYFECFIPYPREYGCVNNSHIGKKFRRYTSSHFSLYVYAVIK